MIFKILELKEVATVNAGNSAPQEEELFLNGTYNFYRTSDVGRIRKGSISDSLDKLNKKGIEGLRLFSEGTILFPKSGASTFLNHRVILKKEGFVSSHLATIKANNNVVDDRYLFYYLTTIDARNLVQDSNYPSLKTAVIELIKLPVPSLSIQQKIVSKLDAIFAEIDKATAAAEANAKNAEALFQSYLTEVFERGGEGWVKAKVRDVVLELITGPFGSSLHKSDYVQNGVPVINPQNLIDGKIIPLEKTMVSESTRKRLIKFSLKKKDIVIARRGEMGRCGLVDSISSGWLCGTGCMVIRLKDNANENFIYQLLQSNRIKKELESTSIGATMNNLNQSILLDINFLLPPIEFQTHTLESIKEFSIKSFELANYYTKKKFQCLNLKNSILQKAFNGELVKN